jgi:REP element-mobilizing transposase RayT
VKHATRVAVPRGACVHVTLRTQPGIAKLRTRKVWDAVRESVRRVSQREGFRVCELSLMNDHLHVIVEASGRDALTSGMNALCTSLARRINTALGRKGKLFGDRYTARVLKTPLDARTALVYVLNNARRHAAQRGQTVEHGWLDPFSSAPEFPGWRGVAAQPRDDEPWLSPPGTALLRERWRRLGLLEVDEVPG